MKKFQLFLAPIIVILAYALNFFSERVESITGYDLDLQTVNMATFILALCIFVSMSYVYVFTSIFKIRYWLIAVASVYNIWLITFYKYLRVSGLSIKFSLLTSWIYALAVTLIYLLVVKIWRGYRKFVRSI